LTEGEGWGRKEKPEKEKKICAGQTEKALPQIKKRKSRKKTPSGGGKKLTPELTAWKGGKKEKPHNQEGEPESVAGASATKGIGGEPKTVYDSRKRLEPPQEHKAGKRSRMSG